MRAGARLNGLRPALLLLGTELGDEAIEAIRNPDLHYQSLWVYIHLRDIARLYRLASESSGAEHETVYAVAPDIRAPVETAELIERFYPGVPCAVRWAESIRLFRVTEHARCLASSRNEAGGTKSRWSG